PNGPASVAWPGPPPRRCALTVVESSVAMTAAPATTAVTNTDKDRHIAFISVSRESPNLNAVAARLPRTIAPDMTIAFGGGRAHRCCRCADTRSATRSGGQFESPRPYNRHDCPADRRDRGRAYTDLAPTSPAHSIADVGSRAGRSQNVPHPHRRRRCGF